MRNTKSKQRMRQFKFKFMTDEALMAAYAKGDGVAFECLYQRNKKPLFLFLIRQCGNRAICEELAHDTWLAVIRQARTHQATAKFKTWLFRIAHNRLIDHWRKHGESAEVFLDEVLDSVATSADLAAQTIWLDELLDNLQALSKEQMEAVLLKIEGFSQAEIALITSAKQETVKSRLRYAVKRLRISMEAMS